MYLAVLKVSVYDVSSCNECIVHLVIPVMYRCLSKRDVRVEIHLFWAKNMQIAFSKEMEVEN